MKKASKNGARSTGGDKGKKSNGLTVKEQLFIDSYLSSARFNATEAARQAGYKGNDGTLAAVGYENLRKPHIAGQVQARLNESAMSANEVLSRLSDIARGKVTDVVDEDGRFDLKLARRREKDQLLKKLKVKRFIKKVDSFTEGEEDEKETIETSLVTEEVEFEMYSAHEALRDLGKFHKLFTERLEHTGKDGAPLLEPVSEALTKIYGNGTTANLQ